MELNADIWVKVKLQDMNFVDRFTSYILVVSPIKL